MMGLGDVRARVEPNRAATPVDDILDGDLDRLNKAWREKRDSFRASQSSTPEPGGRSGSNASGSAALAPAAISGADGGLSAAAASGCEDTCRRILERGLTGPSSHGPDGSTPLCVASLWGHCGIVQMLLDARADPRQTNAGGTRPTALHTAALQENGKICMVLLRAGSDPHALDGNGVSPSDFASCSEAVWPLFAAAGCARRTPKEELVAKGVIRRASAALEEDLLQQFDCPENGAATASSSACARGVLPEYSRPGSAYVVSQQYPPRPGSAAAMTLNSVGNSRPGSSRRGMRPAIDILAEGDESAGTPDASCGRGGSGGGRGVGGYGRLGSLGL